MKSLSVIRVGQWVRELVAIEDPHVFRTLVFVPGGGGVGQSGEHTKARVSLYSLACVVTYVALRDDNTGR